jgi:hypothetical protein
MDRSLAAIGACVIVALAAGFVVLSWAGSDTTAYALFVAGPLVSGVVGIVLKRRVDVVAGDVAAVKHKASDILSAQLETTAAVAAAGILGAPETPVQAPGGS